MLHVYMICVCESHGRHCGSVCVDILFVSYVVGHARSRSADYFVASLSHLCKERISSSSLEISRMRLT